MPRRSKVELSPETIAELEEQFYNFLHSLSPEETNKFFKEFLTTEEKMMMYKRLALYWSLFEGYSLASIQRMLGITHDTTRIYNKRKNEMSSDFKNLLHRIGRDENGQTVAETVAEEEKNESKEEDEPVVVEETITVVEEVIVKEPQNDEQEASQPVQTEEVHEQTQDEQEKEEMEVKTSNEETESTEPKDEENKEEENPEKKKKGIGRFFGF
jgi:hypothetical protein